MLLIVEQPQHIIQ